MLLALICLCIVRRLRPDWLAVTISGAARAEGFNAERISRLASRALGCFEPVVARLTRTGRPTGGADNDDGELAVTRALLDVATSILQHVTLRKSATRALIVGAYLRLRDAHPRLTQKQFCQTLAVSPRTLRHWLKNQPANVSRPVVSEPRKSATRPARPSRRGRFDFAVTVPDTQFAADTTNLRAFGVSLKLIATQDIGGRDQSLLDAIIVDDHESADRVVEVITTTLADHPGAQFLSDQGTPYLALKTRNALEQLEVEHAVQKEGDPLGKATIERAFGTVKRIASPLLKLTDCVAETITSLSRPDLAIALTTLLVTALLRAYQAGARASHRASNKRPADTQQLIRVAEQSRQRARADDRSARLLLARIHGAYGINGSERDFVRRFSRLHPVPVLHAAERAFARQAHRDDIRNRAAYFGAIARSVHDDYRKRQARDRRDAERAELLAHHDRCVEAERAAWHADPDRWLYDVLTLIAAQWTGTDLLFGGLGVVAWLRHALTRLADTHGSLAVDVAAGVFCNFEQKHLPAIGPAGVAAVRAVLERDLDALPRPSATSSCVAHFADTLLGPGPNPRPPPSPDPC